jgi:hypothetical protein
VCICTTGTIWGADINGKTVKETLANLRRADVRLDVEDAVLHGDYRFMAIRGYAIFAPEVYEEDQKVGYPYYEPKYGV